MAGSLDTSDGASVPAPLLKAGPVFVVTFVGICSLLAVIFLLRKPLGTGLKRRIEPHLGEGDPKQARKPAQERFVDRLDGDAGDRVGLRPPAGLAPAPSSASSGPTCRSAPSSWSTSARAVRWGSPCVATLFGAGFVLSLLLMALGGALPIMFVAFKAKRRLTALEDQLPDLLITLAASLKAGHSFRQGIQAVVDEGQPPASTEFKRVLTETQARPPDGRRARRHGRAGRARRTCPSSSRP